MRTRDRVNLMQVDRWGYVAAGAALLAWGMRRRGLLGGGAGGMAAWLMYQAYTGNNPMFEPLDIRVNRHPAETGASETIVVEDALTIGKPREEIYRFWRDLNNLPRFAPWVRKVEVLDELRSRWEVEGPHGAGMQWESEITRDIPNEEIGWRTTANRSVANFGSVSFRDAPAGRGTIVRVHLEYVSPAGSLGAAVARLMGRAPQSMVEQSLRSLKQLLEAGEVATVDGQSSGRASVRAVRGAGPDAGDELAGVQ